MIEELYISDVVKEKLITKHNLNPDVVMSLWNSYIGVTILDTREQHRTIPPTEWFLARDANGLIIKLAFILDTDGIAFLKTAYPVARNAQTVIKIFRKFGGLI